MIFRYVWHTDKKTAPLPFFRSVNRQRISCYSLESSAAPYVAGVRLAYSGRRGSSDQGKESKNGWRIEIGIGIPDLCQSGIRYVKVILDGLRGVLIVGSNIRIAKVFLPRYQWMDGHLIWK